MNTVKNILLVIVLGLQNSCSSFSDPLPKEVEGKKAEYLADQMLKAINASDFYQAEGAQWTFRSRHYLWHKAKQRVRVSLKDDLVVYIDLNGQQGWALSHGKRVDLTQESEYVQEAIRAFNNDSFWAFAPFKIRDSGTSRAWVDHPNGQALLVFYKSGGSTPGDHYLWYLDRQFRPKSWQMWVSIIPIGGVSATWEGWKKTESGAWVSTKHEVSPIDLEVKNLRVTKSFNSLGIKDDLLIGQWPSSLSR